MALEISQVLQQQHRAPRVPEGRVTHREAQNRARQVAEKLREQQPTAEDVRRSVEELRRVSQNFNKRLSFNYNEELGQMVVKVIDRNTDKVIKELPPAELQRAHIRIREAIGLLLDETI
ncbi:MAG: flagellar protein FlaG [Spirochaetaceae bacterium]|nr:MAG: flagellar protein FlaG [Spirochaetaceae bacterium]